MKAHAKLMGALVLGAGLWAGTSATAADPKYGTAAFFYDHCKAVLEKDNSKELYRQGECAGILGALSYISEQLPDEYKFCSPADVTAAQLARVAIGYMDKNKSKLDTHLIMMALAAFRQEWPCKS